MLKYWILAFRRFSEYYGRSGRKEYWYFQVLILSITILIYLVTGVITTFLTGPSFFVMAILYFFVMATLFLPGLSLSVRRLHDINASGFWILLTLIPVVGVVALTILYMIDSTPGENKYGHNPKEQLTISNTNSNTGRSVIV